MLTGDILDLLETNAATLASSGNDLAASDYRLMLQHIRAQAKEIERLQDTIGRHGRRKREYTARLRSGAAKVYGSEPIVLAGDLLAYVYNACGMPVADVFDLDNQRGMVITLEELDALKAEIGRRFPHEESLQ